MEQSGFISLVRRAIEQWKAPSGRPSANEEADSRTKWDRSEEEEEPPSDEKTRERWGQKERKQVWMCTNKSPEALETLRWIMWTKRSVEALSRFKQNKRAIWLNKPAEEKQTGF